jgi:predicted RNA binding protein YcfA (HicA-like mRNA interferase family)
MSLSDLPLASGRDHQKVFQKAFGFRLRKNGNHIIMTSPAGQHISIPNHPEVKKQTLKDILRGCGIEDGAYREAFDRCV